MNPTSIAYLFVTFIASQLKKQQFKQATQQQSVNEQSDSTNWIYAPRILHHIDMVYVLHHIDMVYETSLVSQLCLCDMTACYPTHITHLDTVRLHLDGHLVYDSIPKALLWLVLNILNMLLCARVVNFVSWHERSAYVDMYTSYSVFCCSSFNHLLYLNHMPFQESWSADPHYLIFLVCAPIFSNSWTRVTGLDTYIIG